MVYTGRLQIHSEGGFYALNITEQVRAIIRESGVGSGAALIYYTHTTGCLMIVEHEAGILVDLQDVLEQVVPRAAEYKHHLRGYDSNGAAHVRAALLSVSVMVPVLAADLLLGTYQEIIMIDMDEGEKVRHLVVQVMGEPA